MKQSFTGLFLAFFSVALWASVQAKITPEAVDLGQSVQFIISVDNFQQGDVPDLSGLHQDFTVLGTQKSLNYSLVNGQARSQGQWIIMLEPKHAGQITIPAIPIGSDSTSPIMLTVRASAANPATKSEALTQKSAAFFDMSVSNPNPMVNQEVILTVKLYNRFRLLDADYTPPEFDAGLIMPIGESISHQELVGDIPYQVEEQKYALFPQKSGKLTITPPRFKGMIFSNSPERVRIVGESQTLDVQAIPAHIAQTVWLPAKRVDLTDTYDSSASRLPVGETVTRTIVLRVTGMAAPLIPNLTFQSTDEYSVYASKVSERTQFEQGELVAYKTIKVEYLFDKPGAIHIPEYRFEWFNTETRQPQTAYLAEKTWNIIGKATQAEPRPKSIAPAKTGQPQESTHKALQTGMPYLKWLWSYGPMVLGVFCIIVLGFFTYRYRQKHRFALPSRKVLEKRMREKAAIGDYIALRDYMLLWGERVFSRSFDTLGTLKDCFPEHTIQQELGYFEQYLYGSHPNWRPERLIARLTQYRPVKKTTVKPASSGLPPLNPM